MKIYNVEQLKCMFRQYNADYFGGILPMPDFEVIHSFHYFGFFHTNIDNGTTFNPLIQISDSWEYEEYQARDIMVHEMIHYYLAYTGKDLRVTHGAEFHRMASELNSKYFLRVTEIINVSEYKKKKGTSKIKCILSKLFCF
jgi:hypothetical protein